MSRFLVIEDEPVSARLLQAYLSHFGLVDVAADGFQALRMFRTSIVKEPYTAVFLDILMPVLDGVELLTLLRQLEAEWMSQVPIVVVSSLVGEASAQEVLGRIRCEGFLRKPVRREALVDTLMTLGVESAPAFTL